MAQEPEEQEQQSESVTEQADQAESAEQTEAVQEGDDQAVDNDEATTQEGNPVLPDFTAALDAESVNSIDLLNDVELDVKIELGRAEMNIEEILKLSDGSVIELDKLAGDPVDIMVNEQLVARGEVLVVNDNFCVRISEIVRGVTEAMAQQS